MPGEIRVMQPAAARLRADQADKLRQALLPLEDELPEAVGELLYRLDCLSPTRGRWLFLMISPEQFDFVIQYLLHNSERPMQAVALWSRSLRHLNMRTGQIHMSRKGFAEALNIPATTVSSVMSDLRKCGAISTRRVPVDGLNGPGVVHYFLNPMVGTHLTGKARDLAQQAASPMALPERSKPRLVDA